jgi:uracil-DNA glycosylase
MSGKCSKTIKTEKYICSMEVKIEESWKSLLQSEFDKPYFEELISFVKAEYTEQKGAIFPKENQIFRAFDECPVDQVKVVILGQDPYPTKGHAHGLCFSVEKEVKPFPKSLLNIFKEIESDLGQPFPENGSLEHWASQGVLLLNSVLTVREGSAASHSNRGWEQFTDAVITLLSSQKDEVVYLLWGSKAIDKAKNVDPNKNLILTSVHPSPLSAYRGFFGCKHFSKTNDYLKEKGKEEIQW